VNKNGVSSQGLGNLIEELTGRREEISKYSPYPEQQRKKKE